MHVVVVGAGYWGPNLIRSFLGQKLCTKVSVCDQQASRLHKIQERFPGVGLYGSYDDVLKDPTVDACVIATPVDSHHMLAKKGLLAGKHVFVEKPLASSVKEAEELCVLSETHRRVLMVGHTFEYSPPVRKIADLVHAGELGKLCFISSTRVNLGLHRKDVSVIWDLAPHDFSMLFGWLRETPLSVSAVGRTFVQAGLPDVAFISCVFPSQVVAHIEVSWLAPCKLRRTMLVGDKKMALYDDTEANEKVKIYDRGVDFKDPENFGEFQLSYRTGDILTPHLDQSEPLALESLEFLSAIAEQRKPRTDGASGLAVVKALTAAHESLHLGGEPIRLL